MDSKKIIKRLSKNNEYMNYLYNIILDNHLSSDNVIDLMEIPYEDITDSQETIIIDEEIYNYLINSQEPFILIGKRVFNYYQSFIYITSLEHDDGQVLDLNSNDVFILYHPLENSVNKTLEQDNILNYFNNNRKKLKLRNNGMNLMVYDVKNLINFEQRFYNQQIDTFNLIKNGDELNIIYNDNGNIKCVVNLFIKPRKNNDYIPINTYFNHVDSDQNQKRKVIL